MRNPLSRLAKLLSSRKTKKSESGFVKTSKKEIFKYPKRHELGLGTKRSLNTVLQRIHAELQKVMWADLAKASSVWVIEAGIEGLTANWMSHYLFGVPLTWQTVLAHGFLIKQGVSVFHRLRKADGDKIIEKGR